MNEETTFIYQQYLGGDNSNEMLGLAQTIVQGEKDALPNPVKTWFYTSTTQVFFQ